MKNFKIKNLPSLFLLLCLSFSLFLFSIYISKITNEIDSLYLEASLNQIFVKKEKPTTLIFVGDMMLDRGVEYMIKTKGKDDFKFPFLKIADEFKKADVVSGNLEGPIVENPPKFPPHSLTFAFSPKVLEGLSFAHFNLLSLANNHTENMGKAGLKETREFLAKANINFLGDPIKCDEDFLFEKNGIIFFAFNKTFPVNCSDEKIFEIIKKTRNSNLKKILIVIFHWGNEYQLKSSNEQKELAHKVIDAGADLVIGSHPHVIQEIEKYKGTYIIYSLGNFIFDQAFSKETMKGLMVKVSIKNAKIDKVMPIEIKINGYFQPELKI
jgi:poly-gamma-glutamate synthesis protein (capsule biosynthesis protein)